jgi:hypothetical protein
LTFGDIPSNRLLINVPPGFMKSLLVDVFWPAWERGPCICDLADHQCVNDLFRRFPRDQPTPCYAQSRNRKMVADHQCCRDQSRVAREFCVVG